MGSRRSRIFLSYRRADSAALVGHLYDRLVARYGAESVFRDIDDMQLGRNFRDQVKAELSTCDIVLAVIGPRWLGDGLVRLQQEDDPVRIELEAALASGAAVIPVFVEGAAVPNAADLPASLHDFPSLHAARIDTGKDFNHHVDELIRSMDRILSERGKFAVTFPKWAMKAAAWSGAAAAVLILAIIVLALLGVTKSGALMLAVIMAASGGLALSCGLAGGHAAAQGRIPVVLCQKHPAAFSAAGGVLALALLLTLGAYFHPLLPGNGAGDSLGLAGRLRVEFASARDALERTGVADFKLADEVLGAIKLLDPHNGHASYFAGEIRRVRMSALFTLKSCPKPRSGAPEENLDIYQEDFHRYKEVAMTLPAVETGGDTGSEVCYTRARGYCLQRTAWIYHLLANDFYHIALAAGDLRARVSNLRRAKEFVSEARKYRRPEGGEGFDQCTNTATLAEMIDDQLTANVRLRERERAAGAQP